MFGRWGRVVRRSADRSLDGDRVVSTVETAGWESQTLTLTVSESDPGLDATPTDP